MQRFCESCGKAVEQDERKCETCRQQANTEVVQEGVQDEKTYSGDGSKKLIINFIVITLVLSAIMLVSLHVFRNSDYSDASFPVVKEMEHSQHVDIDLLL